MIVCVPTALITVDEAVQVAVSGLPLSPPVPIDVPPSWNVTVPVGVPDPVVTVAVNVTLWPNTDEFGDELTVVEVAGAPTTRSISLSDVREIVTVAAELYRWSE